MSPMVHAASHAVTSVLGFTFTYVTEIWHTTFEIVRKGYSERAIRLPATLSILISDLKFK